MKADFEQIYQTALKKDSQEIKKYLHFTCIDEWVPRYSRFSVLASLASEEKKEAAVFLISKVSNVNYALLGTGLSENFLIIELLRRTSLLLTHDWQMKGVGARKQINKFTFFTKRKGKATAMTAKKGERFVFLSNIQVISCAFRRAFLECLGRNERLCFCKGGGEEDLKINV